MLTQPHSNDGFGCTAHLLLFPTTLLTGYTSLPFVMRLIKEYCCCAIPLLNAGIYTTLTEQFVVSVTAGALSLATPPSMSPLPSCVRQGTYDGTILPVVGISVPSFVPDVFAVLCFVAAAIQLFGFLGVSRVRFGQVDFQSFLTFPHRNQPSYSDVTLPSIY